MEDELEYFRIGTSYYKINEKPLISGETTKVLVRWRKETIIEDFGKAFLRDVPKLDGFCCIPNHVNYEQFVNNFYNKYHELPHKPSKIGEIKNSIYFVEHIFGEQKELGLDYLKILFLRPTQTLPILCLVSQERGTGKSTFIHWLKAIFGHNMTYIKGDSFSSQFNSDWASKTIIAMDEVFFDKKEITERLKYLSTTDKDKVEAKGKDREEIEFFGKFILCSNNEENFIVIDSDEIRFWVRKIRSLKNEDTEFLSKLKKEIPAFLQYLMDREFSRPKTTRMWFSADEIKTKALRKVVWLNNNEIEREMVLCLYEIFDVENYNSLKATPQDLVAIIKKMRSKNFMTNNIRKVLKKKWNLDPSSNSNSYRGFEYTTYGEFIEIDRKGRFYEIPRRLINNIFDEMMM